MTRVREIKEIRAHWAMMTMIKNYVKAGLDFNSIFTTLKFEKDYSRRELKVLGRAIKHEMMFVRYELI